MKSILGPFQNITFQNMSTNAVVTSSVTDTRRMDNLSVQVCVSGSPAVTGTISIQASVDHQFSAPSAIIASNDDYVGNGTWFTVTSSLFSSTFGTAYGSTNGLSAHTLTNWTWPFCRVIFVGANPSAGSGSVWINGKSYGA